MLEHERANETALRHPIKYFHILLFCCLIQDTATNMRHAAQHEISISRRRFFPYEVLIPKLLSVSKLYFHYFSLYKTFIILVGIIQFHNLNTKKLFYWAYAIEGTSRTFFVCDCNISLKLDRILRASKFSACSASLMVLVDCVSFVIYARFGQRFTLLWTYLRTQLFG